MKNTTNFEKWISAITEDPSASNFNFNSKTRKIEFTYKPDVTLLLFTPTYTLHMEESRIILGAYFPVEIIQATFNQIMSMYNACHSFNSETPEFVYDKQRCIASVRITLDDSVVDNKDDREFHLSSNADLLALRLAEFMNDFNNNIRATTQLSDAITSISRYTRSHYPHAGTSEESKSVYNAFDTDWSDAFADDYNCEDDGSADCDNSNDRTVHASFHASGSCVNNHSLPGSRYHKPSLDTDDYWTDIDEGRKLSKLIGSYRGRIARYLRKRRLERFTKRVHNARAKLRQQTSRSLSTYTSRYETR